MFNMSRKKQKCSVVWLILALACTLGFALGGCADVEPNGFPSAPPYSSTPPSTAGGTDSTQSSSDAVNGGDQELEDDSTSGGSNSSGGGSSGGVELPDQPF
jgi:hypothetical protein